MAVKTKRLIYVDIPCIPSKTRQPSSSIKVHSAQVNIIKMRKLNRPIGSIFQYCLCLHTGLPSCIITEGSVHIKRKCGKNHSHRTLGKGRLFLYPPRSNSRLWNKLTTGRFTEEKFTHVLTFSIMCTEASWGENEYLPKW